MLTYFSKFPFSVILILKRDKAAVNRLLTFNIISVEDNMVLANDS